MSGIANAGSLIDFLSAAAENEKCVLKQHAQMLHLLDRVHRAFRAFFNQKLTPSPLPGMLMINAYASYLGAVRTAVSGQSPPTFMILRGALESALYAVIANDESKAQIWYERHHSEHKRILCGRTFSESNARKIFELSDPNLAKMVKEVYNSFIDLGGHPNILSVLNHANLSAPIERGQPVALTILYDPSSASILQTLMACLETGIIILCTLKHAFPDHDAAVVAHHKGVALYARKEKYLKKIGFTHPEDTA